MKFRLCGEVCRITPNRQIVLNCDGNYKEKPSRPKRLRLLEVEGLLSQIEAREGCWGAWHLSWDLNTVEEESTWVWRNTWGWVWIACLAVEIVTRNALSTSLSQLCPHTKVSKWEIWRDWCHFTEGRILPKFQRRGILCRHSGPHRNTSPETFYWDFPKKGKARFKVWHHTSVILTLRRLRHKNLSFKTAGLYSEFKVTGL